MSWAVFPPLLFQEEMVLLWYFFFLMFDTIYPGNILYLLLYLLKDIITNSLSLKRLHFFSPALLWYRQKLNILKVYNVMFLHTYTL